MKGKAPIRRTLQYLNEGKLVLKDKIRIFSVNFNPVGKHHHGARFVCDIHIKPRDSEMYLIRALFYL